MTPVEPTLRTLALVLAVIAGHAPLMIHAGESGAPTLRWFTAPFLLLVVLLGAAQALQRELTHEVGDVTARLERYAPLAVGCTLAGALAFPTLTTWTFLWSLCLLQLPLVWCWHLPRPRTISLWVASLGALGAAVLLDTSALGLLAIAAAWLAIPALETVADERARTPGSPPLPWGSLVVSLSLLLAIGLGAYGVAAAALPATHRSPIVERARRALDANDPEEPVQPPSLPLGEVLGLLGTFAALLALGHAVIGRPAAATLPPPEAGAMQVDEPFDLDPLPPTRHGHWPPGPRRALVERYVQHVERLTAGAVRPNRTAQQWAESLPPEVQGAARSLASRFGAARYSPTPVTDESLAEAVAEARDVETRLPEASDP